MSSTTWPRMCDTCNSATCAVFCRFDSAYLCAGCDARVHAANTLASRHERVWVCEACERAPAAFLCKADAASLCSSCDADIHSANPLASRHQRVPILPITGFLYGPPTTLLGGGRGGRDDEDEDEGEDEDEAASWLLLNNPAVKNSNSDHNHNQNHNLNLNHGGGGNNGFLFSGEVDEYLVDLVDCNSCGGENDNHFTTTHDHFSQQQEQQQQQHFVVPQKSYVGDSVVPVQQQQTQNFHLGLEFESPKPDFSYNNNGSITQSIPSDFSPMDREARVLRYREKKKTRKFEKTIRYASRKAYAETRPRIKGRFAKRTDAEAEVDQMFSTSLITEVGYGIVPSF